MEALAHVADAGTDGDVARVPDTNVQPITAIDVAGLVARVALEPPAGGVVEVAGPQTFAFCDVIGRVLAARNDRRRVVPDADARYFGALVRDGALLPGTGARIATQRLADWLSRQRNEPTAVA